MDSFPGKEQTCCFTGHRPSRLPWKNNEKDPDCIRLKERITEELELLYRDGVRHFMTGMAQGADMYFAEAVLALRERRKDITLEAAIPCRSQADARGEVEQKRYRSIVERCDMETLVQREYSRDCMLRRNRYMVERSRYLLAVYDGMGSGGTMYTLNYAMNRDMETRILSV